MKIAMANDHAGLSLKLEIKTWLEAQGHAVIDFGTHTTEAADPVSYTHLTLPTNREV